MSANNWGQTPVIPDSADSSVLYPAQVSSTYYS